VSAADRRLRHPGLRWRATPCPKTGFLRALCVVVSAVVLLVAPPGVDPGRADDATTTLKIYFGKEGLGERDAACSQVAAVVRQVPRT
jgi:hypothetical protein